jgi:ribosomal protein L4
VGNQTWMAQNLNTTRFQNGDSIFEAKNNEEWSRYFKEKKPAWCYSFNDTMNKKEYGLAVKLLLRLAYKQNRLLIVQSLNATLLDNVKKTREIENLFLSLIKIDNSKKSSHSVRFIMSEKEYKNFGENFKRASSNISKTYVINDKQLSLDNFVKPTKFIFTLDAFLNIRSKFI